MARRYEYDLAIRERWGFWPDRESHRRTLMCVYRLLMDEATSEFGFPIGPVDMPERPDRCDHVMFADDDDTYREAMDEWRDRYAQAMCRTDRVTSIEELDEWLRLV